MNKFNIRVYGILMNERNEVLVSDEQHMGRSFTKFPGGGLEWGEGLIDCLKREFVEELRIQISVEELFYITDFFQISAFNSKDQIISIYYFVKADDWKTIAISDEHKERNNYVESHRWISRSDIHPDMFELPIDKVVVEKLIQL